MKNLIVFFILVALFSCKKDDDMTTIDPNLIEVDMTKDFLLNEKWFLNNIEVSDDCELDNFYVFDLNNEDSVVIQDGENICETFSDNYGPLSFSYSLDASSRRMVLRTTPNKILGGFENPINAINGVSFIISKDSSFKLLKGSIVIESNGTENTSMKYELIARVNDRL